MYKNWTRLFPAVAVFLALSQSAIAATLTAARLWPSPDYTRIAVESGDPLSFKFFTLDNPLRLVVDLDGVTPGDALNSLSSQLKPDDPLIAGVRCGLNRPGVTRLVFELKVAVKPSVFALKPQGDYGNRLVIDLYPANTATNTVASQQGQPDTPSQPASPVAAAPVKLTQASIASVQSIPAKPVYSRLMMIAVDAGHGGEDPGASGANGSHEKNITLEIARKLKAKIDAQPNMRAYLTRDGDYFVPLGERVAKARAAKADLFVSIHADSFVSQDARGSSVFALSEHGATSAAARWLARKENDADLVGGVNIDVKDQYLKRTLIDLSQTATISDSLKLAHQVLDELGEVNDLHRGRVEQAGFAVLKAPDIPSILVETAFISNPDEEKRLNDEGYQDKLTDAILSGIRNYLDKHPQKGGGRVTREM